MAYVTDSAPDRHMSLRGLFISGDYTPAPAWSWLTAWLTIAFVLRAGIALAGDFLIHPDETAQYLEPAHWLAFGYGVLPAEYFYGARNWLMPGLVAGVLWLSELGGIGEPWFYINAVKLMFCLLSLLIPWGVYHYSRSIMCETAARTALMLACVWPYLIAYAHKPMTEFVASSVFMAALGLAVLPSVRKKAWQAALLGILITLVALIRWQYAPAAMVLWIAAVLAMNLRAGSALVGGTLLTVTAVGVIEWYSWGGFFSSYRNNLRLNLALDLLRDPQPQYFYATRMIYATAGGILLAAWMILKKPKPFLLLGACMLALLIPHMFLSEVKQFRFLFLFLILSLVPLAGWFDRFVFQAVRPLSFILPIAVAGAHSILVLGNVFPYETWLHEAHSQIRVAYLRNQSGVFAAYRDLAASENIQGVILADQIYLYSPNYYYLHQRVPLYDQRLMKRVGEQLDLKMEQLASHIVTSDNLTGQNQAFELLWDYSDIKIYRNSFNHVPAWQVDIIWAVTADQQLFFSSVLGNYRKIPSAVARLQAETYR